MSETNEKKVVFQSEYWHPSVTTDCIIFGYDGERLNVLLVQRGEEPFKNQWAFPGGFFRENDKDIEDCARRELKEETGLDTSASSNVYMKQIEVFSAMGRDPRPERVITVPFIALVKMSEVKGGDDAKDARWFPLRKGGPRRLDVQPLAFDHDAILEAGLQGLRNQIHFEPIGFDLMPEKFTMKELQTLYEAILEVEFDRGNFSKKMTHLGILKKADMTGEPAPKNGAFLYEFDKAEYEKMKREKGFRMEFSGTQKA